MIDISVEINGRKVNPRNIQDAMESMIVSGIIDNVKKSLQGIRCPEHGDRPKIKLKGRNLDNLSIEVSGCCDSLINAVKNKL